jgi:hypothetical protein
LFSRWCEWGGGPWWRLPIRPLVVVTCEWWQRRRGSDCGAECGSSDGGRCRNDDRSDGYVVWLNTRIILLKNGLPNVSNRCGEANNVAATACTRRAPAQPRCEQPIRKQKQTMRQQQQEHSSPAQPRCERPSPTTKGARCQTRRPSAVRDTRPTQEFRCDSSWCLE